MRNHFICGHKNDGKRNHFGNQGEQQVIQQDKVGFWALYPVFEADYHVDHAFLLVWSVFC